jgi:hypothetical protein
VSFSGVAGPDVSWAAMRIMLCCQEQGLMTSHL